MHERRFNRDIERLRDPERVARMEVERVVDLTLEKLDPVHNLLDVGTGSGLFAEQFAARGLSVTGLDANPAMLPAAEQFVPTGSFQEGTAEALPFPDGSFDVVFMGLLLHETDDVQAALREAHRVARRRVGILEWPEAVGEFGPPAEHRLRTQVVEESTHQAGFTRMEMIHLKHLIFYRLTP
ncbi:MAG: class I SAM-dependent methyltransferase [Anaerolineaceae bacterium]